MTYAGISKVVRRKRDNFALDFDLRRTNLGFIRGWQCYNVLFCIVVPAEYLNRRSHIEQSLAAMEMNLKDNF